MERAGVLAFTVEMEQLWGQSSRLIRFNRRRWGGVSFGENETAGSAEISLEFVQDCREHRAIERTGAALLMKTSSSGLPSYETVRARVYLELSSGG